MKQKTLDVYYKGKLVGTLAEAEDKRVAFQYSDGWLNDGFAISPFSLPLRNEVFLPKPSSRDFFNGLFGVFSDSLPDTWGQLLLERFLSSQNIDSDSISILDKLAYIGTTGMGALEYYPSKNADYSVKGIDFDSIAESCKTLLSSKTSNDIELLYKLGGSSGGTRPKIFVTENDREWIVKFPSGMDSPDIGKIEYDYSLCAKKSGIIMTDTALVPSKTGSGYFKTARFDRSHGEKILSITFSGILEVDFRAPSCDYSTYMKLVNILTKEDSLQIEQMFRVMCFNVFTHNLDDHTKNFSFLRKDNGWILAPAYDLTYSNTYYGEHTTSVNNKGKNITDSDLISVGIAGGLSKKRCLEIIDELRSNLPMLEHYLHI